MYELVFLNSAKRDAKKVKSGGLLSKVEELLRLIRDDSFQTPPPCKALVGDLQGYYSRRINLQHRLVYSVDEQTKIIRVLRLWNHY